MVPEGSQLQKALIEGLSCNTSGSIDESSATEKAMLKFLNGLGVDFEKVRTQYLPHDFTRFHFTSKRKKMSTILENVTDNEYGYTKRVHMKGASEIVLGNCTKWINQDGQTIELKDEMKQHLHKVIEGFAKNALRTICLAYKDLKQNEGGIDHDTQAPDGV